MAKTLNLQKAALRYMGWCPGAETAAKFLPDKNIPASKFITALTLLAAISLTTYYVSFLAFARINLTSTPSLKARNTDPHISVRNSEPYLIFVVETGTDGGGSYNIAIYSGRITQDNEISDLERVRDLGQDYLQSMDLTINEKNECLISFITYYPWIMRMGDLYVISSADGKQWCSPTILARVAGETWYEYVSTASIGNKVYVVYERDHRGGYDTEVLYVVHQDGEGWSTEYQVDFNYSSILDPFIYTDIEGRPNIIGVYYNEHSILSLQVEGMPVVAIRTDGGWSKPFNVTSNDLPLLGRYPKIQYSQLHEGYFLLKESPNWPSGQILELWFSKDLNVWRYLYLATDVWEGDFTVLPSGEIIIVYVQDWMLNVVRSQDGSTWSQPNVISMVLNEDVIYSATSAQTSGSAGVVTLIVTIASLIIIMRRL